MACIDTHRKTAFWPWILLAGWALWLAGCAPGPVFGKRPEGLVVAVPKGAQAAAMKAAAEVYARTGGEPVTVKAVGEDAYEKQVSAVLLAGLDAYDLVVLPAESLARWAGYRVLRPVEPGFDPAGLDLWLPSLTIDGALYGLPAGPDPVVLWYRGDLLAEKGIAAPKDWVSLREAARALNAPPERYAVAFAGSDLEANLDFAAVLAGFGGATVGADGQVTLGADPARRALAFLTGLRQEGLVSPRTEASTRADVVSALAGGRAVFGVAPLSAASTLLDCPAGKEVKDTPVCRAGNALLRWAWLPGLDESHLVGGLQAWAVPLHAAHPAAAGRFAAWLVSDAGARVWAQNGGIPANTGAARAYRPAAQEPGSAADPVLMTAAQAEALGQARGFRLAFPQVETVDLLWNAQTGAVHAALSGEQAPDAALQTAAQQVEEALRQAGYSHPAE